MVWQYILLQTLIALLPIGAMLLWLTKPERLRHIPVAIVAASGVSLLLGMLSRYPLHSESIINFRLIPYIIGSLYGGIPGASLLTVLYMVSRLLQVSTTFSIALLGLFFLLIVPYLFTRIQRFQAADRAGRLRIGFCGFLATSIPFVVAAIHDANTGDSGFWYWMYIVIFGLGSAAIILFSIQTLELSIDRIKLQVELQEVSSNYRKEVKRLQEFIDISPLVAIFIDGQGRITQLNEMALKLLSPYDRSGVLHRPYWSVLNMFGSETLFDSITKVMKGAERESEVVRFRNRLFYTAVCAWRDEAKQETGAVLIAHDMTELQQLKDEVDKMERLSLVGQMAASITHEIRNPMAVIRGFIQLLNERSPNEHHSYFHIILQELDRANNIINDFLSLAQNRIVEKNTRKLNEVLEDLMPLISADANMRGQMIELRIEEDIQPLELNVKEIKQLILNLARNGMEAMTDKGILRIELKNIEDGVQLKVRDTGIGIPPEKLERLFEPFFTTKTNGTGLGLALCLSIVERHHGKIQVESKTGEGTTFIVSFNKYKAGQLTAGA
ncbi:ATP-binding protein [Cohnella thailandensis]|uniref:histidine kinase n=1 Tax=Cohnella thailandensis TaxID=557557 RepID=A0A841T7X1_9BACL|nr:ATP-binding protein [Cohnella thailandensis]MBB6637957.1 histidine kinase [Cohnella thailandensis]MBP1976904.1 PAS domain S-box-containing protein [Cohnella thailandensis]